MRVKELRKQVEAMMASDLLEEAKIIWTFLIVCRSGGMGAKNMALRVNLDEAIVLEAIEVLKEAGLVERKRGVFKPKVYLRTTQEVSTAPKALRDEGTRILEVYQEERTKAGARRLIESRGHMKYFERLAEWLNGQGVEPRAYIQWAGARCEFMKEKRGILFPAPNLLAGDWLRGEWENGGGTIKPTTGHAGKAYSTAAGLKDRLVAAGFDRARGFTKADIRHIESWAMDMVAMPDDFADDDVDQEFGREILWLRDHLSGSASVSPS